MHSLTRPEITFDDCYNLCISRKRPPLKENLERIHPSLSSSANLYDNKATNSGLNELSPIRISDLTPITAEDLKKLYTQQMVGSNGPGRSTYDKILVSAKQKRCCFCSYEEPTELDHFLPKSVFAEFSILPLNLIPSCHRCNKLKLEDVPTSLETTYIHPYYEEYRGIAWLKASLNFDIGNSPTIIYFVDSELNQSHPDLAPRINFQFTKLDLGSRYSQQSAGEVSGIRHRIQGLFSSGGVESVRSHLKEEAKSREQNNKNSWQAALYHSLYQSNKFCTMDWVL
ncbi:MAG: hypothetical protein O2970_10455 [Proteobacteria bacterium]|nr:hypothetical protein [Pseudomonadota bacterium]MDA0967362.1 hypothetical protein [Pseudomonadota bacterium]